MKNQGWMLLTTVAMCVLLFVGKNDYPPTEAVAQSSSVSKTVETEATPPEKSAVKPLTKSGQAILDQHAETLTRSTPPPAAQSRFRFKTADGGMTVSIFQPGISFTIDEGVLLVEGEDSETIATIGTAPGGILLVQQGDTLIECANFVRLKKDTVDILHVNVTGGISPLASLRPGIGQTAAPKQFVAINPSGPGPSPNPAIKPPTTPIPEKVKIVD